MKKRPPNRGRSNDHINNILGQSLRTRDEAKLLSVSPVESTQEGEKWIQDELGLDYGEQVVCWDMTAQDFMEGSMSLSLLAEELFPEDQNLFVEIPKNEEEQQRQVPEDEDENS